MNEHVLKQSNGLRIPDLSGKARRQRWVWVLLLLVAVGAGIAYFTRPRAEADLYRFDRVERRTLIQLVDTSGSLDVRSRVEVPAPIAGRLTAIAVRVRQQVEKGQLLATLDARVGALAVRSAEVNVEAASGRASQAQVAVVAAQKGAERVRRLRDKGLASQQEAVEAENALDQARAAQLAARAESKLANENLAGARLQSSLSQIVAPEAGVVLRAPEDVGAAVAPEREPLFVIAAPLAVMRVEAQVSETEIANVAPGRKAEILVQALPGRSFSATVDHIGIEPKREAGVVVYPVTLLVENPDGALMPGMSARVRMEVARAQDVVSVHEAALRFSPEDAAPSSRSRVWRKNGGPNRLEPIEVTLGVSDGVYIAIEGPGIAAGDQIAIGLLRPGSGSTKPNVSLGQK